MVVISGVGLVLNLLGFVDPSARAASVLGHATGLVVGVVAGVGERYVSPGGVWRLDARGSVGEDSGSGDRDGAD